MHLNCRIGIDHIAVVLGQFIMHVSGRMGKRVAVLVDCATLYLQSVPLELRKRSLQAQSTIHDENHRTLQNGVMKSAAN